MWDNYKKTLGTAPYLGRQKFGTCKQDSLDLRFIKGKNGLPVSLKASNFDAQAELREVGGFSDIQNSMPFYREGYMVTEKEEQEYDNYRTSENSSLANNVLREISKKPMMLIEGALVVPERQVWQLLAPTDGVPKVKVVLGDKNYVVDYTADNGAEHKEKHFKSITGTSAWDKPTTCAPLDDLITARRDFAKATGYSLTRFTMNTETWEMVLKAEDTKKQVLGITAYNGGIRLQQGQVTEYLRGYGIEIEVYDNRHTEILSRNLRAELIQKLYLKNSLKLNVYYWSVIRMKLIDVDALKKDLESVTLSNGTLVNTNAVLHLLEEYPTAYDVDKVVEQLEKKIQTHECCIEYEKKNGTITEEFQQRKAVEVLKEAVEIVKAGGNA